MPPSPTLPANQSSQFFFININTAVKLSSKNAIHVKQQHNIGFLIFKFTQKYMQCLYYLNTCQAMFMYKMFVLGKVFPILSISLLYPKESFTSNFKTARKKNIFQWSNFQLIPIFYHVNKRIPFQLIHSFEFDSNLNKKIQLPWYYIYVYIISLTFFFQSFYEKRQKRSIQ